MYIGLGWITTAAALWFQGHILEPYDSATITHIAYMMRIVPNILHKFNSDSYKHVHFKFTSNRNFTIQMTKHFF